MIPPAPRVPWLRLAAVLEEATGKQLDAPSTRIAVRACLRCPASSRLPRLRPWRPTSGSGCGERCCRMNGGSLDRSRRDCGNLRHVNYRVTLPHTKYGPINASVHELAEGFVGSISPVEYPNLPAYGPLPGEPLASSIEEAAEQLRRALA